ncbi:protein cueball isoform X1 [Solenopsis invicta]|uniref:protein cueball isoform X1 n=1 Tax=Solenopsis invicta TaxID=13686 RepID=UPI0005962B0A|nr:protein cueball isoform X1 [Solenopsis invicta]
MISAEMRYLLPTLLLVVATTYAQSSWDLAVVIGNEIEYFARNGTSTGLADVEEAVELAGITYDDTTRTMYLSDVSKKKEGNNMSTFSNASIFLLTERTFTSTPLLKKEKRMHVDGMVFDTSSRTLFWVDPIEDIIAKMHIPQKGKPGDPVVLHTLTGNSPRGIALDVCNSRIYWTNSNKSHPSIEYSNLDGSNRTVVINRTMIENLYEPVAVVIDHAEQKLYWIDDIEGVPFNIGRSNLDGSQWELLLQKNHQQPIYLAVDNESIYWSDSVSSTVWTMPKNPKAEDNPTKFITYNDPRKHHLSPAGIVTRDNVRQIDCAMIKKRPNLPVLAIPLSHVTTRTESVTIKSSKYCLNDGYLNKTDDTCRCKEGFTGLLCEISLSLPCHNYCLHGTCTVNHRGLPECKCMGTFSGARCERDVCNDYCLYDGECSVRDGKPFCSCKYSKGTRCEELNDIAEICASSRVGLPSNVTSCKCTGSKLSLSDSFQNRLLLPIFVAFTALFLLMIAILSYYVNKLRRRPRIKRHYVVSKGVTPLTSRPDNQCEITIENCCNMNICETPCFEPKLRNDVSRSKSKKKEEKNFLLDNMDDNSC